MLYKTSEANLSKQVASINQYFSTRYHVSLDAAMALGFMHFFVSELPSTNSEAYDYFLRGRDWIDNGNREGLLQSLVFFQAFREGLGQIYFVEGRV